MFFQVDKNKNWLPALSIILIAALAYLPLLHRLGYTFDDWYLMWAVKAQGVDVFHQVFSGDRPLRAYVQIPAYLLFGEHALGYNLSAVFFRMAGGISFWWLLTLLWPGKERSNLGVALLFVIYPGFLSMINGIDYQAHMIALAFAVISLALTVFSLRSGLPGWKRIFTMIASIVSGLFYLGLMEYYIGFEAIRLILIATLAFRNSTPWVAGIKNTIIHWLPWTIVPVGFLSWRLFFFEGDRQATNPAVPLLKLLVSPRETLVNWITTFASDMVDIVILAWIIPLQQIITKINFWDLSPGFLLGLAGGITTWYILQKTEEDHQASRLETLLIALGSIAAGLIPIILSNREVLFPHFSRYTLISSTGATILLALLISYIPTKTWRTLAMSLLIFVAILTHFGNNSRYAHESDEIRNFWWQVAWRVPMFEPASTIIARYPTATIQEDYFIWGPANLIYYPVPGNEQYIQTTLFAALPTGETAQKVVDHLPQEYYKRREIVTYTNYSNIIIFFQPDRDSCVRVVGGEFSDLTDYDPEIILAMEHRSETVKILFDYPEPDVPEAVFGSEPAHGWCYFYQKASLARQQYQWDEVLRLGQEARQAGFAPANPIEWIPFLQAEALLGSPQQVDEISKSFSDPVIRAHACQALLNLENLSSESKMQVERILCNKSQ